MLSENATLNYVSAVLQEKNVPEKFSPVMTGILSRSYFNQDAGCMEIVTNTYVKKEIARKIGLKSPGLVGSGINNLTDAGLLMCVESGVYRLSPEVFGKRPWGEVQSISMSRCFCADESEIRLSAVYVDGTEEIFSAEDDEVEQIEGSEANFEVAEDDFDESFGEDMEEYDEGYDPAEEE